MLPSESGRSFTLHWASGSNALCVISSNITASCVNLSKRNVHCLLVIFKSLLCSVVF